MSTPLPLTDRDRTALRLARHRLLEAEAALPLRSDLIGVLLVREALETLLSDVGELIHGVAVAEAPPSLIPFSASPCDDPSPHGNGCACTLPAGHSGFHYSYISGRRWSATEETAPPDHPKADPLPSDRETHGWHTVAEGGWECG